MARIPAEREYDVDGARQQDPPWMRAKPTRSDSPPVQRESRRQRVFDPLSLEPQILPPPPSKRSPWIFRLALIGVAAGAAIILTIAPYWFAPVSLDIHGPLTQSPESVGVASPEAPVAQSPRLVVEDRRAYKNEPILLGLSLILASGHEFLLLRGLQEKLRLSAGQPVADNSWRLSAFDLGNLFAYAPQDYVGTINAVVELHSADNRKLDSQQIRLEWVSMPVTATAPRESASNGQPSLASPSPVKPVLAPDDLALLLRRGRDLMRLGDIAGARLVFRRAADTGNAEAALSLASTFDPVALRELGVVGFAADAAQALKLYEKALALGSTEAQQRIQRLKVMRSP